MAIIKRTHVLDRTISKDAGFLLPHQELVMVMKIDDKTILLEDGRTLDNAEVGDLEGNPVFHFNGSGGSRLEHPAEQPVFINQPWGFNIEEIKICIDIWQGEVDKNAPLNHGQYQHKLIPNNRLTVLPNQTHLHLLSRFCESLSRE